MYTLKLFKRAFVRSPACLESLRRMTDAPAGEKPLLPDTCPTSISVAFVRHDAAREARLSLINRAVSWRLKQLSPQFEHCQLVFEWGTAADSFRASFSTTKRRPSAFVGLKYENKGWAALRVTAASGAKSEEVRLRL